MDHLTQLVDTLTVKKLQKQLSWLGVNLRGKYKEDKGYYVSLLIETLRVS